MSDENNTADVIHSLVQELNNLKNAATTLEEARTQLAVFEEMQGKRISSAEDQIRELKFILEKHLSEKPPASTLMEEVRSYQDRQERWLKIEMENIDQRLAKIEDLRNEIHGTSNILAQLSTESQSAKKSFIWLFSWLLLLSIFLLFIFMRSLPYK